MTNSNEQHGGHEATSEPIHISTVRRHLIEQLASLRAASTKEDMERELERSKGVTDLARAVVETSKVEVDYLKATGQGSTPFLEAPSKTYVAVAAGEDGLPRNGITSIVRHRLQG